MDEQRIKEVFSDEAFAKDLLALDEPAEVQAALKEKGVELSIDEIIRLGGLIGKAAEKAGEDGELSVDQLDEAAGGFGILTAMIAVIAAMTVIGGAAGNAAAARRRW